MNAPIAGLLLLLLAALLLGCLLVLDTLRAVLVELLVLGLDLFEALLCLAATASTVLQVSQVHIAMPQ